MNKLIQLKDKNNSYYPRNAIKQVSNLAIMIGGSITDLNIKKAKQIIIYYIVDIKNI